jgi:hypothetical protein
MDENYKLDLAIIVTLYFMRLTFAKLYDIHDNPQSFEPSNNGILEYLA